MKSIIILTVMSCISLSVLLAQQTKFGITHYNTPKDWNVQRTESAVQYMKADTVSGEFCVITLYESIAGKNNSKENFDSAWKFLVKDNIHVSAIPEMQPVVTENGWETQSGVAVFENEGNKGVVMLVTSSRLEKMVNIVLLFNSDRFEKEVTEFLESVSFSPTGMPGQETEKSVTINGGSSSIVGNWGRLSGDKISYYNSSTNTTIGGLSSSSSLELKNDGTYIQMTLAMSGMPNYKVFSYITGTYSVNKNYLTLHPKQRRYRKWQNGVQISDEYDRPPPITQQWYIKIQPSTGKKCLYLQVEDEISPREYCKE